LRALPDGSRARDGRQYAFYLGFYMLNVCPEPPADFTQAKACADRLPDEAKQQFQSQVSTVLTRMDTHLNGATIPVNPPPDPNCRPPQSRSGQGVDAYTLPAGLNQEDTGPETIHLCPGFWVADQVGLTAKEEGIRELVHESAHLSGINTPEGIHEEYCWPFTCDVVCNGGQDMAQDMADAWAHLVQCLSGAPLDRPGAPAGRVEHGAHH
jgi:hypothetical protein